MTAWRFPLWRCAFAEYQASVSFPFTLVIGSEQRSDAKIFLSGVTQGAPAAEGLDPGPVTDPAQREFRLLAAGQLPAPGRGAAAPSPGSRVR
jgi:hypothetical protein